MPSADASLAVFSDVVCPWCFIGKRRLEQALATLPPEQRPSLRWHAFQLDPGFPAGKSVPSREHLAKKFGGAARMKQMTDHVGGIARGVGIAFDFDRQLAVNTRLAHRAVAVARNSAPGATGAERESAVVEALFKAHFEEGKDLADVGFVASVLAAAGVADGRARLDDGAGNDDVERDLAAAAAYGVSGVPFFILNDKVALSGAQPMETFVAFLTSEQAR